MKQTKKTKKLGDCYVVGLQNVIANEDLVLCHGVVSGQGKLTGKRFGHAWNETVDGYVIDKSNGNDVFMPRELYYAIGEIDEDEVKRYDVTETLKQSLEYGTYGPWDD